MNKAILLGRLTKDPEIRYSAGENAMAVTRFSIAVNRKFKNSEGGYDADYPNCVAFGKTAEFINKWFHKGDMIGVTGRLQTGSYTNKDGAKVYTTDVIVEESDFAGSKNSGGQGGTTQKPAAKPDMSFMNIPDDAEEQLPF